MSNWDVALGKTFRQVEKLKVEFRADMLNAFNHIQWSGVSSTFSDANSNTFGRITGARDGRFVQFLRRLSF